MRPLTAVADARRRVRFGAVFAAVLAHDLLHVIPPVSDCATEILDAALSPSAWWTFTHYFTLAGYSRPLFYTQNKLLFDVAGDHVFTVYRLYQAAWVVSWIALFVRVLHVRSRGALAAVPLALCVFVGIHTLLAGIKEIYPVNHELQIGTCVMLALNLAESRGGLAVQIACVLTLVFAALVLESGQLVWVVLAAGWMSGMPGVSRRTVIVASLLVGIYLAFRLTYGQTPNPFEHESGYLLQRLNRPELQARFGDRVIVYRLYNVASSMAMVLFSEPRNGVWVSTRVATKLLVIAIAAPGVILAAIVVCVFTAGIAGIDLLWHVDDMSLPEAIVAHDNGEIVRLIERGADPNAAAPVRPGYAGPSSRMLTPLEAAVVVNSSERLTWLMQVGGARVDEKNWTTLRCLAQRSRWHAVANELDRVRPSNVAAACSEQ